MSPVFAGREAELAVLGRAFEDAAGGVPGTVLVGAEAGGGKSRLVGEFATRVAGRALVLAGGCVDLAGAGLPYAPFTAALRGLVRERGPAAVTGLLGGRDAGELAGLLPEFGTPQAGADPATARARLFELLLGLFEALAERRPLVLVVEDVHWADRPTRDLLGFLVRNLRHAGVLLVVTFRSDQLEELPEQTQQVLRAAAAGDVRVGHTLLAAVTGLDDAALAAALRSAVAANVVVADADNYAFRHNLIRQAVREDLLPGERAQAERAFAAALEAGPALGGDGIVQVQIALHWRGANEYDRALRAAWEAAADAGARFAFAEQLQMLEQVLDLWDRVPAAAEHTAADRAGVVELAADAARWAHEPERGLALVEPALDEACESGDPGRRAALLLRRAVLRQHALLPGSADDLQTALRLAGRPDRLRAEILGQISRALLFEDRHEEARQPAEQMLALATRLGDQECQNEAVITLAQIDVRQGHDSLSALQDARETARRIGSVWHELRAYGLVAHMLEGRGDHERAIQAGREGLARARQLGLGRFPTAPLVGYTAESLTSAGRWDEALQVISDGLSLDLAPRGRAFLLVLRGRIAVARGEQETASRIVEQLHTLLRSRQANTPLAPPTAILTIEVRLAQGDLTGALAAMSTALAPLPDAEPRYLWPLLATGMRACADAVPARLPPEVGGRAESAVGAGAGGGGPPAPGPGRAGSRRGLRRRGLPRRWLPGPGRLGHRRRGMGIARAAVPAGLRAAALRGRRRRGRRPGRRGLPAAAGGGPGRPAPRPPAAGADQPAGAAGARRDRRNQPGQPGRAVRADRT